MKGLQEHHMRDAWALASFVVTALGLPFAIAFFMWEQRKERDNEEEEAYQLLSDAYIDFLRIVLANPDLHLRSNEPLDNPTSEPVSYTHLDVYKRQVLCSPAGRWASCSR